MKRLALVFALLPSAASAQLTDWLPSSPNEHGSVRVEIAITPEGRATDCHVVRTSGTATLDASACQLAVQQSRWQPAKSGNGMPQQGAGQLTFHFIMPHVPQTAADLPIGPGDLRVLYSPSREAAQKTNHAVGRGKAQPPQRARIEGDYSYPRQGLEQRMEGVSWVVVDIDAKGRPTGCSVARSSGYPLLDNATCDFVRKNLRYKPGTDYYGRPIPDVDLFMLSWRLPN